MNVCREELQRSLLCVCVLVINEEPAKRNSYSTIWHKDLCRMVKIWLITFFDVCFTIFHSSLLACWLLDSWQIRSCEADRQMKIVSLGDHSSGDVSVRYRPVLQQSAFDPLADVTSTAFQLVLDGPPEQGTTQPWNVALGWTFFFLFTSSSSFSSSTERSASMVRRYWFSSI